MMEKRNLILMMLKNWVNPNKKERVKKMMEKVKNKKNKNNKKKKIIRKYQKKIVQGERRMTLLRIKLILIQIHNCHLRKTQRISKYKQLMSNQKNQLKQQKNQKKKRRLLFQLKVNQVNHQKRIKKKMKKVNLNLLLRNIRIVQEKSWIQ